MQIILDEIIIFNGLAFASSFIKLRDKKIQNNRRDGKSQTLKCLSQLRRINLATSVPIKSLKDVLKQLNGVEDD